MDWEHWALHTVPENMQMVEGLKRMRSAQKVIRHSKVCKDYNEKKKSVKCIKLIDASLFFVSRRIFPLSLSSIFLHSFNGLRNQPSPWTDSSLSTNYYSDHDSCTFTNQLLTAQSLPFAKTKQRDLSSRPIISSPSQPPSPQTFACAESSLITTTGATCSPSQTQRGNKYCCFLPLHFC